jgi:hypothetical protein
VTIWTFARFLLAAIEQNFYPVQKSIWQAKFLAQDIYNNFKMSENAPIKVNKSGLAPLVLTLVELLRQLMEAQVIRRMEADLLSEAEIERAADSLQALEQQILTLCEVLEIDPDELNLDLGDAGKLLPKRGGYYPGHESDRRLQSWNCSIASFLVA